MFNSLLFNNKNILWTIFHVFLGFLSVTSKWFFIVWLYFFFFSTLIKIFNKKGGGLIEFILLGASYLCSLELLGRMIDASPWVPYELSKYILIFLFSLGVLFIRKLSRTGRFMLFLLFPALFFSISPLRTMGDIIYNFFGPVAMALGIGLALKFKFSFNIVNNSLRLVWLGCIPALVFAFLKTPDFNEINFTLAANFDATGGEASNQVATIFGLGMFLSFYSWFNRLYFSGYRILDLLFAGIFAFQAILTFSRGGMLVGIFAIVILIIFNFYKERGSRIKRKRIPLVYFLLAGGFILFIFTRINKISGGKLVLRYQGETEGTLLGRKEKDLNVLTTNRFRIFLEDLALFSQAPLFGVGVGSSKYLRATDRSNPHIELSRLLAEHGILGMLFLLLWIYLGVGILKRNKLLDIKAVLIALYFIGFATCLHSGMRTFITPLLITLSVLNIMMIQSGAPNHFSRRIAASAGPGSIVK